MGIAICLLSGGMDSVTALYAARNAGYEVKALTFHYGQLHGREIESAKLVAADLGIEHYIVDVGMPWKGSALLDKAIPLPRGRKESEMAESIPSTYVPARNSVFLALAASYGEAVGAKAIYIGANALDYSGYPDCRPDYFEAFRRMLDLGTKRGVEGQSLHIEAPLLKLTKKEIIQWGLKLRVPFEKTWSCYQGEAVPCEVCDACKLRAKGFAEAGLEDPLLKHKGRVFAQVISKT